MQIVQDYRILHQIPETGRNLPKTLAFIHSVLRTTKGRLFSPALGSICCYFDFGRDATIAFRADMDALPLDEKTDLPHKSRHPGLMHACGHDGHTAILLELARRLNNESDLPHNVLLIFQPAEETDGGAKDICKSGIFRTYRVSEIYGLHLWPGLPKGQLFSRPGVLMSRSCQVTAEFQGESVHIANAPAKGDALQACMQFYACAGSIKRQRPFLLRFGRISGGSAGNVICGNICLQGSLRTESLQEQIAMQRILKHIGITVARRTGCRADIGFSEGYPAVRNDPQLWQKMQKKNPVSLLNRGLWTADDFSFYQREIPGIYYLMGVGDTPPLHSPYFSFDEQLLSSSAAFFHQLAKSD